MRALLTKGRSTLFRKQTHWFFPWLCPFQIHLASQFIRPSHPFTEPEVIPSTKARWNHRNKTMSGTDCNTIAANIIVQLLN